MIDLHCHSHCSDGKLSPQQLLEYAHRNGIKVLALTDHDTVMGIAEATTAATALGIKLIPGVEITVAWHKNILHIIGLGIDPTYQPLLTALAAQAEIREARAVKIGQQLSIVGINDAYAGAKAIAGVGKITRAHFAQFLVTNRHAKDFKTAFKRYLLRGKMGYVTSLWPELAPTISLIKASGGSAILAHPLRYGLTTTKIRALITEYKQCGGAALEVISGNQSISEINQLSSLCKAYDLLASVGSDFHGEGLTRVQMGTLPKLPTSCTPIWHDWHLETGISK